MTTKLGIPHVLFATALAAGCSGASPDDGGSPQDSKPRSGDDAASTSSISCPNSSDLITSDGTCNNVPLPTNRVPFDVRSDTPPAFVGGTLVDGLYAAIKAEGWDVSTGSGRQMGIVLMNGGTTMLWFGQTLNRDGSGDVDAGTVGLYWLRANFELSIEPPNILGLDPTCEDGSTAGPPKLLYTATATDPPQLLLANANPTSGSPTGAVTTYERQGCP
jgi:hypothetical protein